MKLPTDQQKAIFNRLADHLDAVVLEDEWIAEVVADSEQQVCDYQAGLIQASDAQEALDRLRSRSP